MSSYKDMKNYIHNDCGISKEYIKHEFERLLKEAIDNKIEQCVNDNERLQNIIEGEVRRQVSELLRVNSFFGSYYRKNSLQASIATFYDEVHRKLKENILDNVEITFKDSDKE